MTDGLDEAKASDVTFLEKLQESKHSVVFKVAIHKTTCLMKVVRKLCP